MSELPKRYTGPKSSFLLVKCKTCSNQQVTFSNPVIEVKCNSCNAVLLKPTGGKGKFAEAELVKKLG